MSEKSIFAKVIRNENAHTQLLCNLMEHSKPFRSLTYRFLTGRDLPEADISIVPQCDFGDEGRPDINISKKGSKTVDVLVEVKVDSSCRPTRRQLTGYGKVGNDEVRDVIFLVPRGWKYREKIIGKVEFKIWSQLAHELVGDDGLTEDALFREYWLLLDLQFPSIHFSDLEMDIMKKQETKDLLVSSPANLILVSRKLHRIVDALSEHFHGLRVGTVKLKVGKKESSASEYGFYIKVKEKYKAKERDLLWVGMWSDAQLLLGAGYLTGWHPAQHFEGFTSAPHLGDWNVLKLDSLLFEKHKDAIQEAEAHLTTILKTMLAI